jgi:uncharacterized protein YqeY
MSLKEKIQADLKENLKKDDKVLISVLRLLSSAIHNKEIEKRTKLAKTEPQEKLEELSKLTDEEVLEVISSETKKRKEAILEFKKGNREDLVKKEKAELEILEKYLPEQSSEEEIKKLAKEAIEKVGAKEQKDIGKVMAELMPKVKGKADGSLVSKIVKDLLSPKSE